MKYYFGGGEIKSWRELLLANNVPTVAVSYVGIKRRIKKDITEFNVLADYGSQEIFLDSGAYTLNKNASEYTYESALDLANSYMSFIQVNLERVSLISEFDAKILGKENIENFRTSFYNDLPPDKFMPIWHEEYGTEELDKLASSYEVVGIRQTDMRDMSLAPTFNSVVSRYGVRLHGVAITGREMMKSAAWDSVSSISWLSPIMYGDTIIWTGRELKRYPKAYKAQARKKHRILFMDNGFDHNKIENDDPTELLKLSIWSWQQFVDSISSKAVTANTGENFPENEETGTDLVGISGTENRNGKLLPAVREHRDTTTLPIMGLLKKADDPEDDNSPEIPYLYKRSESMRICNTCFLREKCPGFKRDANCLYNIPIEVKTKQQLVSVQNALIEMQTQRVLFMQMAEDLEGGYADPNLSSEMDRLQRMIKAKNEGEKDVFSMTVTATQSSQNSGFFAKHFGEQAAVKLGAIDPVPADEIIKESDIIDAELV